MTRIVVFTAWLGAADRVQPPACTEPHVEYCCLTDRRDHVDDWTMHRLPPNLPDARRQARWLKTHPSWCGPHDVSVWMDASFTLLAPATELVAAARRLGAPIVGFAHPDRCRIREEAAAIIRWQLAPAVDVQRQLAAYQATDFDTDETPQTVLTTTGLLVRFRTPAVERFNARWWQEIEQHTLRDQLSIDWCARQAGVTIGYLPGHYRANAFAHYDHAAHRRGRVA